MLTGGSMVSYHILNVFHRFNASTDATNALSTSPTPLRHPLRIPADTNLVEPSMFWYVLVCLGCFGMFWFLESCVRPCSTDSQRGPDGPWSKLSLDSGILGKKSIGHVSAAKCMQAHSSSTPTLLGICMASLASYIRYAATLFSCYCLGEGRAAKLGKFGLV